MIASPVPYALMTPAVSPAFMPGRRMPVSPLLALTPPDQVSLNASRSLDRTVLENTPQTMRLGNGCQATMLFMPNRQQSTLYLTLPLSPELSAVSPLLALMLRNGSDETRQRVEALRDRDILLSFKSFPGKLVVMAHGPAGHEAEIAQGMLTLVCDPRWSPDDFMKGRQNLLHNVEDYMRGPEVPLRNAMNDALYGPNRLLSLTPAQHAAAMMRQTPQTLRMLLQQSLQATSSSRIAMASPRPIAEQMTVLNQAVRQTGWFGNPFAALALQPVSSVVSPTAFQKMMLVPGENLKRGVIEMACQFPLPDDPDYPASILLKSILAGHSEGSFFERLRTRDGLVYAVSCYGGFPLGGQSRYNTNIEVDFDKIGPALSELLQVPRQLALQPVSPETLDIARRRLILNMEDAEQTTGRTLKNNEIWLLNDKAPPSMRALKAAILRQTPADIQRVAHRVFNTPGHVQLVGVSAPIAVLKGWFPNAPITVAPL